jgi:hypothetical protein
MGVLDRREFLVLGSAATAFAVCAPATRLLSASPTEWHGASTILFDRRAPQAVAFGLEAARRGIDTFAIDDDAGTVWMHEIAPHWQHGVGVVAGLTRAVPLFCLELLGHDYGMRVVARRQLVDSEGQLFSWIIAPVDVKRALSVRAA